MGWWSRLVNAARGDRLIDDIDEELSSHVAEAIEHGRDPEEARRAFGSLLRHRETSRDARQFGWLADFLMEVRHAIRRFGREPGFAIVAVLSLAIGIGANGATFSVIDELLLRPLPVGHPGELVTVSDTVSGNFSYPDYVAMRGGTRSLTALIAASSTRMVRVDASGDAGDAAAKIVSGNYFTALGVEAAVGRIFTSAEEMQPVAVIRSTISGRRARSSRTCGRSPFFTASNSFATVTPSTAAVSFGQLSKPYSRASLNCASASLAPGIARERGYDEIVTLMAAAEKRRGHRHPPAPPQPDPQQPLQDAVRSGRLDVVRQRLDAGADPDERIQIGQLEDQVFSLGGPLMEAVNTGRIDIAQLLLERGASPNANVFTAGTPMFAAYGSPRRPGDPALIALLKRHGGWINAEFAGYLRLVDVARRMLDGELDPNPGGGPSSEPVAEQLLWSGASGSCAPIVRMALERIDRAPDDPWWFWRLWRPLPSDDLNAQEQADCRATFGLILARCDPQLRAEGTGQTMLHEVIARDGGVGVALATMLLDAGARLDVRDELLKSTPLGWACRWGRFDLVRLLLARGADPIEQDAEPWATPRAWAIRMKRPLILALLGV